jgi:hypothetical protein
MILAKLIVTQVLKFFGLSYKLNADYLVPKRPILITLRKICVGAFNLIIYTLLLKLIRNHGDCFPYKSSNILLSIESTVIYRGI